VASNGLTQTNNPQAWSPELGPLLPVPLGCRDRRPARALPHLDVTWDRVVPVAIDLPRPGVRWAGRSAVTYPTLRLLSSAASGPSPADQAHPVREPAPTDVVSPPSTSRHRSCSIARGEPMPIQDLRKAGRHRRQRISAGRQRQIRPIGESAHVHEIVWRAATSSTCPWPCSRSDQV
jgi:hypothetical protein